jgi:hypothetical protein
MAVRAMPAIFIMLPSRSSSESFFAKDLKSDFFGIAFGF